MPLHQQIEADLRAAMKARDRSRTSALRMAVAALQERAVADGLGPRGHLDDEVVQQVLATEVKRRNEAAAAFRDAGRLDSAAAEQADATVYAEYLPEQLSDEELAAILDEVIAEVGADSPKQLGAVMKQAMERVRGRADGARVSSLAKRRLAG